jgi:hypothetical protein
MAIGTKFSGFTALSGTTAVLLGGANVTLPDGAKQIVAMIPVLTSPAGNTANEPIVAESYLESDDVKVVPYHVLAQPIGSSLLKAVAAVQGSIKDVIYPLHVPVAGGERIACYGKGLFDHTIEPYMGVLLIYSDQSPTEKQCYSTLSAFTNTGTAAARVTAAVVTIVGGARLREIFGFAVGTTVAALKGIASHIDISSEGFTPAWTLHLPVNPISGQVDTNIQEACAGVSRIKVDAKLDDKCQVNIGHTLAVALTTTGNFIAGLLWNK